MCVFGVMLIGCGACVFWFRDRLYVEWHGKVWGKVIISHFALNVHVTYNRCAVCRTLDNIECSDALSKILTWPYLRDIIVLLGKVY